MARFDLTDEEYAAIAPLLPPERSGKPGRPWIPHRKMLDGMFWIVRTGAPWRDLPERYGPWQTVYERFSRWRAEGLYQKILDRLSASCRREELIDLSLGAMDASVVRAHKAAAGARKKTVAAPNKAVKTRRSA